jgi:hypothetical protein
MNITSILETAKGICSDEFWDCFKEEILNFVPIELEFYSASYPLIRHIDVGYVLCLNDAGRTGAYYGISWKKEHDQRRHSVHNYVSFSFDCHYIFENDLLILQNRCGVNLKMKYNHKKMRTVDRLIASL